MLSKATEQLVREISAEFDDDDQELAKEDPEAYLYAMLKLIKKKLPVTGATLRMTIEMAGYEKYVKEAREKIEATV